MSNPNTQRILAALAPKFEQVEVAGFGTVQIRQLTVAAADQARAMAGKAKDSASEFGLCLLIFAVHDTDGNPMFDDPDLPALREAGSTAVEKLVVEVLRVNGLSQAAGAPNA